MHLKKSRVLFTLAILICSFAFVPQNVFAKEERVKKIEQPTIWLLEDLYFKIPKNSFEEEFKIPMDRMRIYKLKTEGGIEERKEQFQLSVKEKEYLILLTYVESGNQEEKGQIAVAATILNRLESPEFPNSIEEIAFQKTQFSSTKNGNFYIGESIATIEMVPKKTLIAVDKALSGEDPTEEILKREAESLGITDIEKYVSGGALYFYNPKGCDDVALGARANVKVKVSIGAHEFYKYWDK